MKLLLFYNINFNKLYIYIENYVIHKLNFMSDLFIWIYSDKGGMKFHETF
jgi:hypothetical protein